MDEKMLTSDIYVYINEKLNDEEYLLMDIKDKREAIDKTLKEYLIHVIGKVKLVGNTLDDADVISLMQELTKSLDERDIDKVISSIIFYVMGLIDEIQKFASDWRIIEDKDAIENPFLTIRGNKLYSLETHMKTDPIIAFKLVYEFLQDKMDLIDYQNQGDMNDIHRLTLQGGLA